LVSQVKTAETVSRNLNSELRHQSERETSRVMSVARMLNPDITYDKMMRQTHQDILDQIVRLRRRPTE
jgi:hypothetical protein